MATIDSRAFRQTVGQFATGVTIVATEIDGTIRAMTANSFTALSLDPPLVLFCIGKATKMGEAVQDASGFSVNILRKEQQDLSTYFAGGWTHASPPSFSFVSWSGGPRLEGAASSIGCAVETILEGGDHWIVIGRVLALHHLTGASPLIFFGGRYAMLGGTFEAEILVSGF
jgi:flavin reductase (DIM6/NTAB) family NADH-FMN oxidoreductase RutF